jgi:hypothetical protein
VGSEQLPQVIDGEGWLAKDRRRRRDWPVPLPIPPFVEAAVDPDPLQKGIPQQREVFPSNFSMHSREVLQGFGWRLLHAVGQIVPAIDVTSRNSELRT